MTSNTDYRILWSRLRTVYAQYGKVRKVAVLDNHRDRKSYICKKLGIVSNADINRIADEIKKNEVKKYGQ